MRRFLAFLRDRNGTTSIEYGVIAMIMAVALVGSTGRFADAFKNVYEMLAGKIGGA